MNRIHLIVIVFFGLVLGLSSCNKPFISRSLNISDIELIDTGRSKTDFEIKISKEREKVHKVLINTQNIWKHQSINQLEVEQTEEDKLRITISSTRPETPDSCWWCIPDSFYTMHHIKFNVHDIQPGKYDIDVFINSMGVQLADFYLE